MSTTEVIRRRRRELLRMLPEEALAEYVALGRAMRAMRELASRRRGRTSVAEQRQKVVDMMRDRPAGVSRKEIVSSIGIRPGTLTKILMEDDFINVGWGMWALRPLRSVGS